MFDTDDAWFFLGTEWSQPCAGRLSLRGNANSRFIGPQYPKHPRRIHDDPLNHQHEHAQVHGRKEDFGLVLDEHEVVEDAAHERVASVEHLATKCSELLLPDGQWAP